MLVTNVSWAINLQNYYFSDSYKYAIIEDSFILKHPGDWLITVSGAYVGEPLVIVEDANSTTKTSVVVKQHLVGNLGFNYHVKRWLSLRVDTHYLSQKMSDDPTAIANAQSGVTNSASQNAANAAYTLDGADGSSSGLGDINLSAKIRLLYKRSSKIALALIPRVEINNGDLKLFNTSDSLSYGGMLVFEKVWKRFALQLGAGYRQTEGAELDVIDYDKIVRGQLGLSYRMNKKWNINLEFDHRQTISEDAIALNATNPVKQNSSDIYVTLKGKIARSLSLYAGLGVAGFADSDIGNVTGFAGLKIHPAPKARVKKIVEEVEVTALELMGIGNQTVIVNSTILPINAELATGGDADTSGNAIAYACSYDKVVDDTVVAGSSCTELNGLTFDTSTGDFNWTPGDEYAKQEFEFKVDGYLNGDLFDSELFAITVMEPVAAVPDVLTETLRIAEQVEFDTNRATIRQGSKFSLDDAASKIIEYQDQIGMIEIQGHTDSRGSAEYNLGLSQRRADSVRNYLIRKGVDPSKLRAIGYGESQLLVSPETSSEDYQANRRTVFIVEETIQVSQPVN